MVAPALPNFDLQKLLGLFRSLDGVIKLLRAERQERAVTRQGKEKERRRRAREVRRAPGTGKKISAGFAAASKAGAKLALILALVKTAITAIQGIGETIKKLTGGAFGQGLSDVGRKIGEVKNIIIAQSARTKALDVSARFSSAGLGGLNAKNFAALSDVLVANKKIELDLAERRSARQYPNGLSIASALVGLGN